MKILTKSVGILFIFSSPTRVTQVKYIEELPDMSDLVHAQPVAEYDDDRTVFPMQGERWGLVLYSVENGACTSLFQRSYE